MVTTGRRFEIADFAALLAGVFSIGFTMWGLPIASDLRAETSLGEPIAPLWLLYAVGGVLAVLAVFVAQRNRVMGRALLVVAGRVERVGVFVAWELGGMSRLSTIVLAVVMLAASTALGPVPVDRR